MSKHKFRQIIVHVGQPKTGTTQIQNTLFDNSAKLAKLGILYPSDGLQTKAHYGIAGMIHQPLETMHSLSKFRAPGDDAVTVKILADSPPMDTLILSAENLLVAAQENPGRFSEFDHYLSTMSSDVLYVAYLRDPISLYPSASSQTLMFSTILPQFQRAFNVAQLLTMQQLFKDRFSVRVYDRNRFKDRDVLADFLINVVGLESSTDGFECAAEINSSLSAEGMYLVQAVGFLPQLSDPSRFPKHGEDARKLASFIRRVGASSEGYVSPKLKDHIAARIGTATLPQLNKLQENFGITFDIPTSETSAVAAQNAIFFQLVNNVFHVDAGRTSMLIELLLSRPRVPKGLRTSLESIPLPVN